MQNDEITDLMNDAGMSFPEAVEFVANPMTLDDHDWWPPLGTRATWLKPHAFTDREAVLAAALDKLVSHDNADCIRKDAPHCVELQHAIRVLNELAGSQLYKPRR